MPALLTALNPLAWNWATLLWHPLLVAAVQLLIGLGIAYLFAERWQRWRQRREFQHRTLVRFSELSYEMMDWLAELLVLRARMAPELYIARRREFLSRWTIFVATGAEVLASYGRRFVRSAHYQGVYTALNALRAAVNAVEPVLRERFEPEQEKFLAYREAVVANMIHAMGLLSNADWKAEVRHSEARVRNAQEQVPDAGSSLPSSESTEPAPPVTG